MATEAEYDEIIAPLILDVAKRCKELGMSIIARVEWADGGRGITQLGIAQGSPNAQFVTQLAAHCDGNVDNLCLNLISRFDVSASMFLHSFYRFGEHQPKDKGND